MKPSLAPLLPKEDAREAALFFVVCALCFLACLSGLVARSAYSAADEWTNRVTGQITIRVKGDDAAVTRAVQLVKTMSDIVSARALDRAESEELLRPWLGATGIPADLPLPHLIAAEASPAAAESGGMGQRISLTLKEANVDAIVDDHIVWSKDLKRATDSGGLAALIAVGLLGAIGISVIAFATHATLLARKDIVELLHLTGAKDSFISSLFEQRFLMLGVQAGALGALLAFGAAAFILFVVKQSGQQFWLLPQLSLSLVDGLILGLSPLLSGIAAMIAAKVTVMRSLSDMV